MCPRLRGQVAGVVEGAGENMQDSWRGGDVILGLVNGLVLGARRRSKEAGWLSGGRCVPAVWGTYIYEVKQLSRYSAVIGGMLCRGRGEIP